MTPSLLKLVSILILYHVSFRSPNLSADDQVIPVTHSPSRDELTNENQNEAHQLDRISDKDYETYQILMSSSQLQAEDQDTTLRQVLIIHRHGDRTPITFAPRDNLANEPFWKFHGLGQLTNRGKARVYMLGKMIRKRYNSFLGGSVNKNMRKSRSSGSLRCIESAQGFLSSFLGLDVSDSPDASALDWDTDSLAQLWQPVSISTTGSSIDGMLNSDATCKALSDIYKAWDVNSAAEKLLVDYKREIEVLNEKLGYQMNHFYKWSSADNFLSSERSYFESKMDPDLIAIHDRIREASDISLGLYQTSDEFKRLYGGLLVQDMITNMKDLRCSTMKTRIFDSWYKFASRPDYASNMLLELHQDQDDEWFVKVFYMPHVPAEPIELHLESCEKGHHRRRCTLDKFDSIMSMFKLESWQLWMKSCKNDLDLIDPYK